MWIDNWNSHFELFSASAGVIALYLHDVPASAVPYRFTPRIVCSREDLSNSDVLLFLKANRMK